MIVWLVCLTGGLLFQRSTTNTPPTFLQADAFQAQQVMDAGDLDALRERSKTPKGDDDIVAQGESDLSIKTLVTAKNREMMLKLYS